MAEKISDREKYVREKAGLTQKGLKRQGYKPPAPETVSGPFSATAS